MFWWTTGNECIQMKLIVSLHVFVCVSLLWGEVTHLFKLTRSEPSVSHINPTKFFSCMSCHILSVTHLRPVCTYFQMDLLWICLANTNRSEVGYEPLFVLVLFVLNFTAEWAVYWLKWICWWSGIQFLSSGMLHKIWLISESGDVREHFFSCHRSSAANLIL